MFQKSGIFIISALVTVVTFAVMIYMPKTFSDEQVKERQQKERQTAFFQDLKKIKSEIDPKIAAQSLIWEEELKSGGEMYVYDSLVHLWDRAMYPQVAAYFFASKAEKLQTVADWNMAGKRFLAVSAFSGEGNREWALDNAQYAFEQALKLDPENKEARVKLAASIVESGQDPMKGIGLLREVVAEDPENVEALMELGRFAMVSGQPDKAVGHFSNVMAIDSSIAEVRFYLSDAYGALGNMDSSMKYLNLYMKKVPNDLVAQQVKDYMKTTYGLVSE